MSDGGFLALVDGGGTGSRLRLVAPDGTIAGEATAGPASLTLGVALSWNSIADALARACAPGPAPRAPRLWCGLAGGRSPARQAEFRATDPFDCTEIVIVTDGFASLVGAHAGRPGTALAVGTGVAAFALGDDGAVSSASAWGFAIGDEGGGAWMGRRAVTALSQWLDGRQIEGGTLCPRLAGIVGGGFDAIQSWLSGATATTFATLAPAVVEEAENGCPVAGAILSDAIAELTRAVDAVAPAGPLALLGGLAPVVAPRLPHRLAARLTPPQGGALDGLALMAARGWRGEAIAPAPAGPTPPPGWRGWQAARTGLRA
ncbi:ATPase [Palleronia sediminis]|uniref:ATPase n=1 Tax=Palleronia sediminis TaxID=2547833 RepID=A0A4R6AH48_9RHOB|nr:BadF/BadG/BcrA/BcrD ATPase family protein [Palleronia sediminis]TDL83501.1 ATPase [Palleronia sediminis]